MWPTATDVALSVYLSDTLVNPAKMAAPTEMPFGVLVLVNPRNHINGGPDHPTGRDTLGRGILGHAWWLICSLICHRTACGNVAICYH